MQYYFLNTKRRQLSVQFKLYVKLITEIHFFIATALIYKLNLLQFYCWRRWSMMTFVIKLWRLQTLVWLESGTEQPKWVQQELMHGWLQKLSSPPCFLKEVIFGGKFFCWRSCSVELCWGFWQNFFWWFARLLPQHMASLALLRNKHILKCLLQLFYLLLSIIYELGAEEGKQRIFILKQALIKRSC